MGWEQIDGLGRVALNVFSPAELATATELSVDMQRVWRRRGHLPVREGGRSSFNAREVAAIAVRQALAKRGIAPSDTLHIGRDAAGIVLYSALISFAKAAEVRGSLHLVAEAAQRFERDDAMAQRLSGADGSGRYLWASVPPVFRFDDDFGEVLHAERHDGFVLLDLLVVGRELVESVSKPLFMIEISAT